MHWYYFKIYEYDMNNNINLIFCDRVKCEDIYNANLIMKDRYHLNKNNDSRFYHNFVFDHMQ